jgi:hypothetical protein
MSGWAVSFLTHFNQSITQWRQKQVRQRKRHLRNKIGCYLVLGLSAVAIVLCTAAAVINISWGES